MKVFLSSTYIDLIEHRKAAHDALEQLGLHVIWMEAFGARPEDSTVACLKEVEESDLFVGIYAHRYGSIPEGKEVSVTEEEFNHAQKLGKPIFGFVVTADFPWNPEMVEFDKKHELDSLLKKVKQQPVRFFTTPENLAGSIAPSVGRYLLTELKRKAQGEGEILFKKLKSYLDSTSKKKVEDDLSSFLVNIQQASMLAQTKGIEGFAELVEFCLIRASLLLQTRLLPANYYAILTFIDDPKKAISEVENIGNLGERALAYAALVGSNSLDLVQKEEFAQKAIELSRQSGDKWEQSSNHSEIGRQLINDLPAFGIKAFKLSLDTIRKAEKYELEDGDIFDSPIKNFENAYRQRPDVLISILPEFVSFVGENGGYIRLLGLAKVLFENDKSTAHEILEKSFLELTSNSTKITILEHQKDRVEQEIQRNKKHLVEVSLLLGETSLAEKISQTTELDFDLKAYSKAISNIKNGDFTQAVEICSSSIIRQEVVTRLFESGRVKDAMQYITIEDAEIATKFSTTIVNNNQVDELLKKFPDQPDNIIFRFVYQEKLTELKTALIKDLLKTNPAKAKELLGTLFTDKEETPFKFPYWAEAALIIESRIKWGEQKADDLINLCFDDFDKVLNEAEELHKYSKSLHQQQGKKNDTNTAFDMLKLLGDLMFSQDNNFMYALGNYTNSRKRLIYGLNERKEIPTEIRPGWELIKTESWGELEKWINNFNYIDLKWWTATKFIDMVRDLVFLGKIDLATNLASHFEKGNKWLADTWLSSSTLLNEISVYDFYDLDDSKQAFIIRAEVISKQNQDLANAYVKLYCEFMIHEKWLDDYLGWDLCDLALFFYNHNDKENAIHYYILGIQHWFQYAMETEDTWAEIVEDLHGTDFDFQLKIFQEILLWNSTRGIRDSVRTVEMFSMFFVNNLPYESISTVLKSIKKVRNWHFQDEIQ